MIEDASDDAHRPEPPAPRPRAMPLSRPRAVPRVDPGLPGVVGWLFAYLGFQIALGVPLGAALGPEMRGPIVLPYATTTAVVTTAFIVVHRYWGATRRRLAVRLPSWLHLACVVLMVVPLALTVGEIAAWVADGLRRVVPGYDPAGYEMFGDFTDALRGWGPVGAAAAVFVFGGLFPGVGEEAFFRGFLGRGLIARLGVVGGVLCTSALFGLVHFHTLQSPVTALIGVLLHCVFLWTRSLVAPVLLHALYNCAAFSSDVLARSADPANGGPDPIAHVPPVLAAASAAAVVALMAALYRTRAAWRLPDGSDWNPGYPTAEMPPRVCGARPVRRRAGGRLIAAVLFAYLLFAAVLWRELA